MFENDHVLVADKPPGVLTVPARTGAADPRPCLGWQLERERKLRLWPVHRLDFEVGGLVLFAKHAQAHRIANAAFESRRVDKRYEALTEATAAVGPLPASYLWESRLVRGKRRSFEAPHGKPARTRATATAIVPAGALLAPGAPVSELVHFTLEPETGRPHQLRVHLAKAGFPVAGDTLYGARSKLAVPDAIALRSVALAFLADADRAALGIAAALQVPGFRAEAA